MHKNLEDFITPFYEADVSTDFSPAHLDGLNLFSNVDIDVLPDTLKDKIVHGVSDRDDRSKAFYHVICELFKMQFDSDAIFNLLAVYPNGIAKKYTERGVSKLKGQVESCFKKILQKEAENLLSFTDATNELNQYSKKEKENSRHAIEFSTIDELMNRPPPEYLIQDILPERGVCTIVGPSRSFKSFVAIALAMHVSQGMSLGTRKVKKGKVLFMINEGQGYFAYRCKAWLNYHEISNNDDFLIAPKTVNLANDQEFKSQLAHISANHSQPALIVIDTLHKASLGINEDSAQDMGLIFDRAQQIAAELSCTVLLVDHTGKDAKRGGRGSYVKFANADMVGAVKRTNKVVSLRTEKQKDSEDGLIFSFEANMCLVPELGQEMPVLIYTEKTDLTQGDFVMQVVAENSKIKKEDLQRQFEQNHPDKKGNFRSVISRLKKDGLLQERNGHFHLSVDDDFD